MSKLPPPPSFFDTIRLATPKTMASPASPDLEDAGIASKRPNGGSNLDLKGSISGLWKRSQYSISPSVAQAAREHLGEMRIVLLHSSTSNSRQWRSMRDQWVDISQVSAPDLAGHSDEGIWIDTGLSSLELDTRRIGALLETAGGAHLVGHGYGGALALEVASRWPQHIRSLIVYEPKVLRWLFDDPEFAESSMRVLTTICSMRRFLRDGAPLLAARAYINLWCDEGAWQKFPPQDVNFLVRRIQSITSNLLSLFACRPDPSVLQRLPLLFLRGQYNTQNAMDIAVASARRLSFARFQEFQGMTHLGPISHPVEVGEVLIENIQREDQRWRLERLKAHARQTAGQAMRAISPARVN